MWRSVWNVVMEKDVCSIVIPVVNIPTSLLIYTIIYLLGCCYGSLSLSKSFI